VDQHSHALSQVQSLPITLSVQRCHKQDTQSDGLKRSLDLQYPVVVRCLRANVRQPAVKGSQNSFVDDGWSIGPVERTEGCAGKGFGFLQAEIRAFNGGLIIDGEVRNPSSRWDRVRMKTCGDEEIRMSPTWLGRIAAPSWWDDPKRLVAQGDTYLYINYECCPGRSQIVQYQSNSVEPTRIENE
jgi:hypothetical protein